MHAVQGLQTRTLAEYRGVSDDSLIEEARSLADALKGARIAHINATDSGGGVAEILHSIIPLYRDLGIDASWLVLDGAPEFFDVTKMMHNALQGQPHEFTTSEWDTFLRFNERNAREIDGAFDVIFVHDPQPAAIRRFRPDAADTWIWRSHIDTSSPNMQAWSFVTEQVEGFDAAVFSLDDFVGPGLQLPHVAIMPPAIDPFVPKNRSWPEAKAREIVASHGVDPDKPFVSQISRFDPWKDPIGVIEAFRMLRPRHPDLQLCLLGNFASDDPEGEVMYAKVLEAAEGEDGIFIITGLTDLVGPFQALSAAVIQKSIREGFALTVTEALWKGVPVVGGAVGGIRLQLGGGVGGFLVGSVAECAEKLDYLLSNDEERAALGKSGREHVRRNFLIPRLLRDELEIAAQVGAPNASPTNGAGQTAAPDPKPQRL